MYINPTTQLIYSEYKTLLKIYAQKIQKTSITLTSLGAIYTHKRPHFHVSLEVMTIRLTMMSFCIQRKKKNEIRLCTMVLYLLYIPAADKHCEVPSNEAGIIWDSICFAFLLLQRRVFMSYYFLHVVADIRASQILASRYTAEAEAELRPAAHMFRHYMPLRDVEQ